MILRRQSRVCNYLPHHEPVMWLVTGFLVDLCRVVWIHSIYIPSLTHYLQPLTALLTAISTPISLPTARNSLPPSNDTPLPNSPQKTPPAFPKTLVKILPQIRNKHIPRPPLHHLPRGPLNLPHWHPRDLVQRLVIWQRIRVHPPLQLGRDVSVVRLFAHADDVWVAEGGEGSFWGGSGVVDYLVQGRG